MTYRKFAKNAKIVVVIIFVIAAIIIGVRSCVQIVNDDHRARMAIESHYPNRGDKVILNGQEIVILKRLVWKTERTYQVRLPDGRITRVMGSELRDIKEK